MSALKLYGRDWKKVEEMVKTRSSTQARSHAQKFFQRMIKSGKPLKGYEDLITGEVAGKSPKGSVNEPFEGASDEDEDEFSYGSAEN